MTQTLYGGVRFPVTGPDLENIERLDRGAWPMTLAMMQRGLQVDLSHFARMEKELTRDMEAITADVERMAGGYVNLDSGDQVAALLFQKLGLKQAKVKLTKSKSRESVEEEVLIAVQHQHPVVAKILDYKELSKLRGTYVVPMPKLATRVAHGVWRMFPNLTTTRIPSGRFACKEPNMLAFPSRTKRGRQIKQGFITDDGWVFVSVDESQIEPRVGAHLSSDARLCAIYDNEEDIYSDFAINAFAIPDKRFRDDEGWHYPGVDKQEHRFPSKTCVLASIYDVSPMGLLEQMPVVCANCKKPTSADKDSIPLHDCDHFESLWTEAKCEALINTFYRTYPGLLGDRKRHHARARQYGYVWDMWGRLLHVAAVRSVHPWVVSAALRETGNFPYQAGACGTLKLTMAKTQDDFEQGGLHGDVVWPLLPIHDELLFEARSDYADEVAEIVKENFSACVKLRVPIKAGAAMAETWGSLEK